jgi:hypothetical protein
MNRQAAFALAHPVYNPETQILPGHHWKPERLISAGLTVNVGME